MSAFCARSTGQTALLATYPLQNENAVVLTEPINSRLASRKLSSFPGGISNGLKNVIGRFAMSISNDSLSLLCRGSSHPLDALPAYPVRPSSQSPVQDLSTAYSGKKGRRHAKRQP